LKFVPRRKNAQWFAPSREGRFDAMRHASLPMFIDAYVMLREHRKRGVNIVKAQMWKDSSVMRFGATSA
jgi:hypothetical protein